MLRVVAPVLLGLFFVLGLWSLWDDSPTVDEFTYPPNGQYYFLTGDFLFNPANPPLAKELGALPLLWSGARLDLSPEWHTNAGGWGPWALGTKFMLDNRPAYHRLFVQSRVLTLLLGVALGVLLFLWARELWGDAGGSLSLFLYALSPNILAHARLATPDLPVTCFVFAASFFLWRALNTRRVAYLVALGLTVGLAFATKFSAVMLLIVLPAQAVALSLAATRGRNGGASGACRAVRCAASVLLVVVLSVIVIDATYGFRGLFTRLDRQELRSPAFERLSQAAPWLRLPVPHAFLAGMDEKALDAARGDRAYLFGVWSESGRRSFYLVSLLIKEPIPVLLLTVAALLWWRRKEPAGNWTSVVFIWLPVALILVGATLVFYRVNYGLRYILPILPFVYLGCGRVARLVSGRLASAIVVAALAAWYAWSSISIFPSYLAYFNELVGGPRNGSKCMVDSNLDWGQDLKRLKDYMDRRGVARVYLAYFGHVSPEVYGIRYEPLRGGMRPSGTIAISASLLQGLRYPITYERPGALRPIGSEDFAWLRGRKPDAMIGYSILVFEERP